MKDKAYCARQKIKAAKRKQTLVKLKERGKKLMKKEKEKSESKVTLKNQDSTLHQIFSNSKSKQKNLTKIVKKTK